MTITGYSLSSSCKVNEVDKTSYLGTGTNMTNSVKLEGKQNIVSPVLTVYSTTKPAFNYVYIDTFARYYFVDSIIWISNNMWKAFLKVDVLMSFKTSIGQLVGVASRLEDKGGHTMIIDDRLVTEQEQYEDLFYKTASVVPNAEGFNTNGETLPDRLVFQTYSGLGSYAYPPTLENIASNPPGYNPRPSTIVYNSGDVPPCRLIINGIYVRDVRYVYDGQTIYATRTSQSNDRASFTTIDLYPTGSTIIDGVSRPSCNVQFTMTGYDYSTLTESRTIIFPATSSQST